MIPHHHLSDETSLIDQRLVRSAYLVAFGLILHDVPEGFAMAVPAVMIRRPRFLHTAAVLSALAGPAGAVIGLIAVGIAPGLNAHFMAFAAGAMTFVSVHELVPMARRYREPLRFGIGLAVSVLVYLLLSLVGGGAF